MLIIYDINTQTIINNCGTNSMFPDGNIPNVTTAENEVLIRIHDDSTEASQIMNAAEYELILNEDNTLKEVIVHKTLAEAQQEEVQQDDLLNALTPTEEDVLDAQIEVKIITTLIELGVIS